MSKELEKATINYAQKVGSGLNYDVVKLSFRAGALWQKKHPSYAKIKRCLAISFMHYLDEIRPEGKMCLSNGECADIDKAFDEMDWDKLARYLEKYRKNKEI